MKLAPYARIGSQGTWGTLAGISTRLATSREASRVPGSSPDARSVIGRPPLSSVSLRRAAEAACRFPDANRTMSVFEVTSRAAVAPRDPNSTTFATEPSFHAMASMPQHASVRELRSRRARVRTFRPTFSMSSYPPIVGRVSGAATRRRAPPRPCLSARATGGSTSYRRGTSPSPLKIEGVFSAWGAPAGLFSAGVDRGCRPIVTAGTESDIANTTPSGARDGVTAEHARRTSSRSRAAFTLRRAKGETSLKTHGPLSRSVFYGKALGALWFCSERCFLLLLACANVANLLLRRRRCGTDSPSHALGAARGRCPSISGRSIPVELVGGVLGVRGRLGSGGILSAGTIICAMDSVRQYPDPLFASAFDRVRRKPRHHGSARRPATCAGAHGRRTRTGGSQGNQRVGG